MTKESLLADLHATRAGVTSGTASLKRELNLEAKLQKLVRHKPLLWFGGAAAVGWILAGPHTKRKVVTKYVDAEGHKVKPKGQAVRNKAGRFGLLLTLLKMAFPYLKPALTDFAARQLDLWAARRNRP